MQSDNELEQLLRKAPSPTAPFGLEGRLIQRAGNPKGAGSSSWFAVFQPRSWAPALALCAVLAGLLTALAVQQSILNDLKQEQERQTVQTPTTQYPSGTQGENTADRELEQLRKQSVELQALRDE